MNSIDEMDRLIAEIKTDVRFIERYIQSIDNNNLNIDTNSLEIIIQNLVDNVNQFYFLTD